MNCIDKTLTQKILMARKITDIFVKGVNPPVSGQRVIFDSGEGRTRGFGIRITPKGTKAFILEYWQGGRQRRYTIGRYPDWSVEAARREAKELRKMIDLGNDPMKLREGLRSAPRVRDLGERYYADHLPEKAEQSQRDDRNIIEKEILPKIGNQFVAEIEQDDVRAIHREITKRGTPVRANRVLAVLSKMFSIAMEKRSGEEIWRTELQGNPCKSVKRNREEGRERFYSEAEVSSIADALEIYPGKSAANLIRLVMLTGCRPGEAMKATWAQFDLESGRWIKPAATTKANKTHRLPLAPPAIEFLQKIRSEIAEDCPYVFPGRVRPGKAWEPLKQYNDCWQFVKQQANLEPDEEGREARVYDLRHSFATAGVGAGLSLPLIGKLLGHTQSRTTQRYAHVADDPLRKAAEKITGRIVGAGKGGKEGNNVSTIGRRS